MNLELVIPAQRIDVSYAQSDASHGEDAADDCEQSHLRCRGLVGTTLLTLCVAAAAFAALSHGKVFAFQRRPPEQDPSETEEVARVSSSSSFSSFLQAPEVVQHRPVLDEFLLLGKGICKDHSNRSLPGFVTIDGSLWQVVPDVDPTTGTSNSCASMCKSTGEACTGFSTFVVGDGSGRCGLAVGPSFDASEVSIGAHSMKVSVAGFDGDLRVGGVTPKIEESWQTSAAKSSHRTLRFLPAWADGKGPAFCYYRQTYKRDSFMTKIKGGSSIPKIIWAFWEFKDELYRPFIELCQMTWRANNPGWQIHLLNESTMLQWVTPAELPGDFTKQSLAHKSDGVRIALLAKYGGVWMDASILLLRPLEEILGMNTNSQRTFMTLHSYWNLHHKYSFDKRVNATHYIENWFMATPPHDILFTQVHDCVSKLQPEVEDKWVPFWATGMFTQQQFEEMHALLITKFLGFSNYLSMHACFLKTIQEDRSLWHWYNGPTVQHLPAGFAGLRLQVETGWGAGAQQAVVRFTQKVDKELLKALTEPGTLMLKVGSANNALRKLPAKELWCRDSTLRRILTKMHLDNNPLCG